MKTTNINKANPYQSGFKISLLLMIFHFIIASVAAQEVGITKQYSIYGGFNVGLLDNGMGPSLAFHFNPGKLKFVQSELAIAFDHQSGKSFLSGSSYSATGISLLGGLRVNFRPGKNWNPSVALLPGFIVGNENTDRNDSFNHSGFSPAVHFGISNTISNKHIITLGLFEGGFIHGLSLKYGLLF
jgi:hypothetical protein